MTRAFIVMCTYFFARAFVRDVLILRLAPTIHCILTSYVNWGEPERAPHKREVRAACLSVSLSVCPYVHDTKIYKNSSNLWGTFSC